MNSKEKPSTVPKAVCFSLIVPLNLKIILYEVVMRIEAALTVLFLAQIVSNVAAEFFDISLSGQSCEPLKVSLNTVNFQYSTKIVQAFVVPDCDASKILYEGILHLNSNLKTFLT